MATQINRLLDTEAIGQLGITLTREAHKIRAIKKTVVRVCAGPAANLGITTFLRERSLDASAHADLEDMLAAASHSQSAVEPEVWIVDPALHGMQFALRNFGLVPKDGIRVLLYSEDEDPDLVARFHCAGRIGKCEKLDELLRAVEVVRDGGTFLTHQEFTSVLTSLRRGADVRRPTQSLSNRESEVVCLVAQGFRNKEMAEKLFISEQTVKNHLHNIFEKLGVSDRLELALYALHKGLIPFLSETG